MTKREFMNKYCIDCHKECVTNQNINECIKSYNDFVQHIAKDKINDIDKGIDNLNSDFRNRKEG